MKQLLLLALFTMPTLLLAQPELVVDYNPGEADAYLDWNREVGHLDGKIFMAIETPETGIELGMISNGQLSLLKDLVPGEESGHPYRFTSYKNKLYFTLDNYDLEPQIWVTEGTEESTMKIFEPGGGYGFGAFTVTKNDLMFFTNDYKLYQFDGEEIKMIDESRSPETHWGMQHTSFGFSTYNDGLAFLDYEDGRTHLFYTDGGAVTSLGSIENGTSTGDYYGLSQTAGGIVFGISDFFGAPKGHYFWDAQTQEIEYMQEQGTAWNIWRHMELDDEKDVVLDELGFHVLSGNQHELLTDVKPDYVTQGQQVVADAYNGKMIFCTNSGFGTDEVVYYTDGTVQGTSVLFQTDARDPQNMILDGQMAYISFDPFTPEFWQVDLETKATKMLYSTPSSTTSGSAELVGVQGDYLYYFSDENPDVGLELYRLRISETTGIEEKEITLDAEINVYPDGFLVNMESQEKLEVSIFDQLGRRVQNIQTQSNQRVYIDQLSGIYHISIKAETGSHSLSHYFR